MSESITRAAGGVNGQEMDASSMEQVIRAIGRVPRQRSTLYGDITAKRSAQLRDHMLTDDVERLHRVIVQA